MRAVSDWRAKDIIFILKHFGNLLYHDSICILEPVEDSLLHQTLCKRSTRRWSLLRRNDRVRKKKRDSDAGVLGDSETILVSLVGSSFGIPAT